MPIDGQAEYLGYPRGLQRDDVTLTFKFGKLDPGRDRDRVGSASSAGRRSHSAARDRRDDLCFPGCVATVLVGSSLARASEVGARRPQGAQAGVPGLGSPLLVGLDRLGLKFYYHTTAV